MKIRGILFDKDGTLIDVDGTWVAVYRHMLAELFNTDQAGAERLMAKAGYDPETEKFKAGSLLAGGTTRQLIDVWWPGLDEAEIVEKQRVLDVEFADVVRSYLKPLMPLEPILDELRTMGYILGIGTNDSIVSARNHLDHLAVAHHFDAVITADTVDVPKPSGNMIKRFCEITGFSPSEIAMVGDNHHDMEEARNGGAGMAIAVLTGNSAHDDIAHLADHTFHSVAELPAFFRSL